MDIIKIDSIKFKDVFNIDIDSSVEIYILKNPTTIGYGLIKDTRENTLNIYIKEEYRSNGYGTKLFKELINIIRKTKKYKDISLIVSKEDTNINNIIKNNGGIEILEEKDKVHYIIPM